MRDITIARNYAETLVELAGHNQAMEAWGDLIDATAAALRSEGIEAVMMTPRVPRERKIALVTDALRGVPRPFMLFVVAVVRRGRQMLLSQIADEYHDLVDTHMNRVRASVTVSRDVDALTRQVIIERLSASIGKNVIAGFATDPALLGGIVVRIGDRIYDGSVRKRLMTLKQGLLSS